MKGIFITFEGIDGSGKSTIIGRMKHMMPDAIFTSEPTSFLSDIIKDEKDAIVITLLFAADRKKHLLKIEEWLEKGKMVISDRYVDSTFAYQIAHANDTFENVYEWIECIHRPFIITPDITFLFILPVDIAMKRIGNREKSLYERKEFLEKVQENYLKIAKREPERFFIVDATKEIDEIVEICYNKITEKMKE